MSTEYPDLDLDLPPDDLNMLDTDSSVTLPGHQASDDGDEDHFLPGSEEYRKARKRRQNRESAARSRARKKADYFVLEKDIEKLTQENRRLMLENQSLKTENEILKKELSFYVSVLERDTGRTASGGAGLVGTTALALLLCVCCMAGTGDALSVAGSRQLLSTDGGGFATVPKTLGVALVCLLFVWLIRLLPSASPKSSPQV